MSQKRLKEKKTDPKIRFGLLRQDEKRVLEDLKEKEKQVKLVLVQLQALRHLLAEVANDMEVDEYEQTRKEEQEERDKQIENLEEIVAEVKEEVEKEGEQTLYTGIDAHKITIAANENSISKMYDLAYKAGTWTDTESKEFFEIRDAVFQVRNYDLATNLAQTVDNVYQAIQVVASQKQDQITENYKPQYSTREQIQKQTLPPLQSTTDNITQQYKQDKPEFKPAENNNTTSSLDSKLNKKNKSF